SRDHAQRLWSALPVTLRGLVAHGPHVINSLVSGSGVMSRAEQAGLGVANWMAELRTLANRTVVSGLEQQALFQQVTNTLQAVAVARPLLIVLDDLQWIDQGSIGLLFHLGRRLEGSRILILGAYRPEEVTAGHPSGGVSEPHPLAKTLNELRREHGDVWIDLDQAGPSEGRQFVEALVATEANRLGDAFCTALYERTGGHALFTVELVRAMQARGDLVLDADGAWVEGESLDWATLPARVEAVIEERLSRLTAQQRELLTVASVEGETFTAQVIAEVQGLSERAVLRELSQGLSEHHRLVRETEEVSVNGHFLTQFAFVHALFQEHLYRELSRGERRLLHGEVATVLEALYGDQDDRIVVPLARHYDEAGNVGKAVAYTVRAGEQARLSYANAEARQHYARALALLDGGDASDDERSWHLAALSGLGKLCFRTGELAESERHLRDAIALGRHLERDPQEMALLYHWLGESLGWQSKNAELLSIGEEGLALVGEETESLGAALMNQVVGVGAMNTGNLARHWELTKRTAGFIQDLAYVEELRPAYTHIARMYIRNGGDADSCQRCLALLTQLAGRHGDVMALASADDIASDLMLHTGDL
ncbi:MAG: hypothetical protein MUQ10_15370, partial [Anaerolineae bacterium]|nr:hypothetical protein [Anaerolineae bacterium]